MNDNNWQYAWLSMLLLLNLGSGKLLFSDLVFLVELIIDKKCAGNVGNIKSIRWSSNVLKGIKVVSMIDKKDNTESEEANTIFAMHKNSI